MTALRHYEGTVAMMSGAMISGSIQTVCESIVSEAKTTTRSEEILLPAGRAMRGRCFDDGAILMTMGGGGTAPAQSLIRDIGALEVITARTEAMVDTWQNVATANFFALINLRQPEDSTTLRLDVQNVLSKAHVAARTGNIRLVYRETFRLLERQFVNARWDVAGDILKILCSSQFPVTVGLGAARFSSSAATKIPGWHKLIATLQMRSAGDGLDPSAALRGLIG